MTIMKQIQRNLTGAIWTKLTLSILLCFLWISPAIAAKDANVLDEAKKTKPPKQPKTSTEWYLKNTVELIDPATGSIVRDTRSGVMGHLAESEAGFDRHDIPAFASAAKSRAAIVFEQGEDWEEMAGEYLSDYRKAKGDKDEWVLTVRSSLSPDQVILRWDGLFVLSQQETSGITKYSSTREDDHDILDKLSLIDLETGEVIKAVTRHKGKGKKEGVVEFNSYEFSMNGQTRRDFRWVLGSVKEEHFEPVQQSQTAAKTKGADSVSALQARQLNAAAGVFEASKFGTPPE
jgi:hypothetical protein